MYVRFQVDSPFGKIFTATLHPDFIGPQEQAHVQDMPIYHLEVPCTNVEGYMICAETGEQFYVDRIIQPGFCSGLPQIYQHQVAQQPENILAQEKSVASPIQVYPKPPLSFQFLIVLAIKSREDKRCTVKHIYNFMFGFFPYFINAKKGWDNSVRHCLSMQKCFLQTKDVCGRRSGNFWIINPLEAEVTNKRLLKAWNKSATGIKASTPKPDALEELITAPIHVSWFF